MKAFSRNDKDNGFDMDVNCVRDTYRTPLLDAYYQAFPQKSYNKEIFRCVRVRPVPIQQSVVFSQSRPLFRISR